MEVSEWTLHRVSDINTKAEETWRLFTLLDFKEQSVFLLSLFQLFHTLICECQSDRERQHVNNTI